MNVSLHRLCLQAEFVDEKRQRLTTEEMELVQDLRTYVKEQRGNLKDLAVQLGLSEQYLSDVSNDRRRPGETLVKRLAEMRRRK